MAYDFLFKNNGIIQKYKDTYISVKKEYISIVLPDFKKTENILRVRFDCFISFFNKVGLIRLNRENLANSTCSCSLYLKKYHCSHIVAIEFNVLIGVFLNKIIFLAVEVIFSL